jgi:glycosyltransferase involved in cell wall biosynthesis
MNAGHDAGAPRISVIVPLYNEEATALALLESLAAQSRPPDEVICVDAGSTDRTAEIVSGFRAAFPVRTLDGGRLYPGEARNEGVRHASHEWIAFIDGGIRADPRWLESLVAPLTGQEVDVVFGSMDVVCDTWFRECAAIAYVSGRTADGLRGHFIASTLLRRATFERVGGFPPYRAAEDLAFFDSLLAASPRVVAAPAAVVRWQIAPGPLSTFRRFELYSQHNLRAGRGRFWHRRLAIQHAAVAVMIVAAWMAGAGPLALLLLPALWLARAGKSAWQKRGSFPFATLDPRRVVGAAGVHMILDVATLAGAIRYWLGLPSREEK